MYSSDDDLIKAQYTYIELAKILLEHADKVND